MILLRLINILPLIVQPVLLRLCLLTILGLRDQNLVMRSMSVRGIAIVASMRLEIARLAINIFLVVRRWTPA